MIAASDLLVEARDAFSSQSGSSLSFTDAALTVVGAAPLTTGFAASPVSGSTRISLRVETHAPTRARGLWFLLAFRGHKAPRHPQQIPEGIGLNLREPH
jgi:hypothetical protein